MIFATAVLLTIVYLIPVVREYYSDDGSGSTDLLSPIRMTAILHFFTTVPFLVVASFNEEAFPQIVREHPCIGDLDTAVGYYGVIQAIAYLSLTWGINSRSSGRIAERLPVIGTNFTMPRYAMALAFVLTLGLGCFAAFLISIGGYSVLTSNMTRRSKLGEGQGYLLQPVTVLTLAAVMGVYAMRGHVTAMRGAFALGLVSMVAVVYSSNGSRLRTVIMIMQAMLAWHYGVRRFERFSWKMALPPMILVPFIVAMPLVRNTLSGVQSDKTEIDAASLVTDVAERLFAPERGIFTEISYVKHYTLITSYFGPRNLWLGRTYLDLLQAPIPRTLFPDKPPVDEGRYIAFIGEGGEPVPGMPEAELSQDAWPPETLGTTYMNFWIPGVVGGMFLLGLITGTAYRYMERSGYTVYSIVIYGFVLFQLHLSNQRLIQAGINMAITTVVCLLFFSNRSDTHGHLSGRDAPDPPEDATSPSAGITAGQLSPMRPL
jgi:hypothetical protein